jgi:predicted metalloprotease
MRLGGHRGSDNVEDRRGGLSIGGRGLGIGSIVIALVASWLFGINPLTVLGLLEGGSPVQQTAPAKAPPPEDQMAAFVSKVLASTEDAWREIFREHGQQYEEPKLVLFSGSVPTACGTGRSAMGPFYCPGDRKVYIDLSFYRDLKERFRAPGDFAQAYVIAHEVGHHVQNLLGIADKVRSAQRRANAAESNAMSVRLELQADCLAGVWGKRADTMRQVLEPGELEEALTAAAAIGDDRLQKQSQGQIVPESFTHGSSAQRVQWFRRGFETGDMRQCNTFASRKL